MQREVIQCKENQEKRGRLKMYDVKFVTMRSLRSTAGFASEAFTVVGGRLTATDN
jgi:hypothetical protein